MGVKTLVKRGLSIKKMKKPSSDSLSTASSLTTTNSEGASIDTRPTAANGKNTSASQSSQSVPQIQTPKSVKISKTEGTNEKNETQPTIDITKDDNESSDKNSVLLPDIERNPLYEIAQTSALLGGLFGFSLSAFFISTYKPPPLYFMALSAFHYLEFYITARYNPRKVHKESFIINNGSGYSLAHTFAIMECGIEFYFFPNFKKERLQWIRILGVLLVIMGQYVRTCAMITAGQSFNHIVQSKREKEHELITKGVYRYFRHPSYFGFFWWAIGSQLLLLNPVALVGFTVTLFKFFQDRIKNEERFLVKFFGKSYEEYRDATPVYIPGL